MSEQQNDITPMKEQLIYAKVLNIGAWLGIVLMSISYIMYVVGVFEPQVPVEMVAENWTNPQIVVTELGDHHEITGFDICGQNGVECEAEIFQLRGEHDELVVGSGVQGVSAYILITESPSGWEWANLLGTGDYLNFVGLALLALLTIVCYMILVPGFLRQKDYIYTTIAVVEIIVLVVAASGILGSGGH
ncbi:MAG: hypothetical protein D6E12_14060 [Desulfovibrio sp.]|nr:MAG: hypothetical protein D6E12_14060 [Desulfovibrio sp.]